MSKIVALPFFVLVLSACVTINIYFPAAAAEEAARTIVRDVLQQGEGEPEEPAKEPDKQSRHSPGQAAMIAFGHVLHALVGPAHAAQADINIDTAAVKAIRKRMQRRQASLSTYYRSGAIGFDNRGTVAVRDLNAVPLAKRNQLRKLVADENNDRNKLYREIAKANGHPEWEGDVRATFARVWVQEAPRQYWYQTAEGAWKQR